MKRFFKNGDVRFYNECMNSLGVDLLTACKLFCEYNCKAASRISSGSGYTCFNKKCPIGVVKLERMKRKHAKNIRTTEPENN